MSSDTSLREHVVQFHVVDTPESIAADAHTLSSKDAEWVTALRIQELVRRSVDAANAEKNSTQFSFVEALRRILDGKKIVKVGWASAWGHLWLESSGRIVWGNEYPVRPVESVPIEWLLSNDWREAE